MWYSDTSPGVESPFDLSIVGEHHQLADGFTLGPFVGDLLLSQLPSAAFLGAGVFF